MSQKADVTAAAVDRRITVSSDGLSAAENSFQLGGDADLNVTLMPEILAKLEAMLAQVSMEQAKHSPVQ